MPAILPFGQNNVNPNTPALAMVPIVPSDAGNLVNAIRQLYVGTGGDVTVIDAFGNTVTHKNAPGGGYLGPFCVVQVKATGTTATDLVGYV